jgi:[ribosomal protein S18]-alanine N-acetyltransferase
MMPATKDGRQLHLRWLLRCDMPAILAIEHAAFAEPWSEDDFLRCLRHRNVIALAAEVDEGIAGYVVYECHKTSLTILNLAVHPNHRCQGVGRSLVEKLYFKLTPTRRNRITLQISDRNLPGHLFFRALGFRCVKVVRHPYCQNDSDAYVLVRRCPPEDQPVVTEMPAPDAAAPSSVEPTSAEPTATETIAPDAAEPATTIDLSSVSTELLLAEIARRHATEGGAQ